MPESRRTSRYRSGSRRTCAVLDYIIYMMEGLNDKKMVARQNDLSDLSEKLL